MAFGEKPVIASQNITFEAVLDASCERLMERQVEYSIRRIQEMESLLEGLERELDAFLIQKGRAL